MTAKRSVKLDERDGKEMCRGNLKHKVAVGSKTQKEKFNQYWY